MTTIIAEERLLFAIHDLEVGNEAQSRSEGFYDSWLRRPSVLSMVGTGPLEMRTGDRVFLLDGVPVPMVLRPSAGEDTFRVLGAALVHGAMHGEQFDKSKLKCITLV